MKDVIEFKGSGTMLRFKTFEITLAIDDKGFGADLAAVQDDYISRSRLLDARLWLKRPLWQRVAERLFYFFSPLL